MHGVEHTVLLFFNDVSKIPILYQMISAHKMIYNIFGSGVYHKPHSIKKNQAFHNKIGLLVEMILGWLDILWGYTETCRCKIYSIYYILFRIHNYSYQ